LSRPRPKLSYFCSRDASRPIPRSWELHTGSCFTFKTQTKNCHDFR